MMKDMGLVRELRGSKYRLLEREVSTAAIEELGREYAARIEGDRRKLERMAQLRAKPPLPVERAARLLRRG